MLTASITAPTTPTRRATRLIQSIAAAWALALFANASLAQGVPNPASESRDTLQARLAVAKAAHRDQEAFLIQDRLTNGDFQEADRMYVTYSGTAVPKTTDTSVTVRAGKWMSFAGRPDSVSLQGVLRSELNRTLTTFLAITVNGASVQATPLLRIGVLGSVRGPGFIYLPANALLSDALNKAALDPSSDLDNMTIHRGPDVIWNALDTRTAITEGLSLERLSLRSGDELIVGLKTPPTPWFQYLQLGLQVLTMGFTLVGLFRKH